MLFLDKCAVFGLMFSCWINVQFILKPMTKIPFNQAFNFARRNAGMTMIHLFSIQRKQVKNPKNKIYAIKCVDFTLQRRVIK